MSLRSLYGRQGGAAHFSSPEPTGGGVSQPADTSRPGKFEFDFTDPVGSTLAGAGQLARIPGTIGEIGVEGGPKIKDPFEAVGGFLSGVVGAAGEVGVGDFHLKDIPAGVGAGVGEALHLASVPAQMIESKVAEARLRVATGQASPIDAALSMAHLPIPGLSASPLGATEAPPADFVTRAKMGEDIGKLAQEMTDRGQGYSSNATTELTNSMILDPLNLLSAGLGKIATGPAQAVRLAKAAGKGSEAAQAVEKMNPLSRAVGYTYVAATEAASAPVKALVQRTIGPATSGVTRALNAGKVVALRDRAAAESPLLAQRFERAYGVANTQYLLAVDARETLREWDPILKELQDPAQVREFVGGRLRLMESPVIAKQIESGAENLIRRKAPQFLGMSAEDIANVTRAKAAVVFPDASPEAIERIVGKAGDLETAQLVDTLFYGAAVDELAAIRDIRLPANLGWSKMVQAERLTPIAYDTLTKKRLAEMLADVEANPDALSGYVDRYSVLSDRFGRTPYAHKDVLAYAKKLGDGDFLPDEIVGRLPTPLTEWLGRYGGKEGYALGYAPKSGWKVVYDGEEFIAGDPFVHIQGIATRPTVRNALGRFGDSLFSAIHQRTLVLTSEQRMARFVTDQNLGIAPAQAVAIHKTILRTASEAGVAPRALATTIGLGAGPTKPGFGTRVAEIFHDHLSAAQWEALQKSGTTPEYIFLQSIRGNLSQIGLTQFVTGSLKATPSATLNKWTTAIAEVMYPLAKFRLNPFFQAQEWVETPFMRTLRGIVGMESDPDLRAAVLSTFEKHREMQVFEEMHGLYLAGSSEAAQQVVQKGLRGAAAKVGLLDIAGGKRLAVAEQVMVEHADIWRDIMVQVDPNAYRAWQVAAGTTDTRDVARYFIRERMALQKSRDAVAEELRKAKTAAFADIGVEAQEVTPQAVWRQGVNRELSKGAGALPRGDIIPTEGAAAKAVPAFSPDEETAWNAWVYSVRRASEVARQTQYFREGRGWLERTLNHPFLGIYPLSYASKVWMEFARFLLTRPFGLHAPLAGYVAFAKFQHHIAAAMQSDDEFLGWVQDHPHTINFVVQMLPYWPAQVGASAPLWVRTVAQQAEAGARVPEAQRTKPGQNVTPSDVPAAIAEQWRFAANPLRMVEEMGNIGAEFEPQIRANLKRAKIKLPEIPSTRG